MKKAHRRTFFIRTVFILLIQCSIRVIHGQTPAFVQFDEVSGNYLVHFQDSLNKQVYSWSFEPANKLHPFVDVNIDYNREDGSFVYSYNIQNGTNSRQNLVEFAVGIQDSIIQQSATPKNWKSEHTDYLSAVSWIYDQTELNYEKIGIKPGASANGFTLISKGWPSIIPCYFIGNSSTPQIPKNLPSDVYVYLTGLSTFPNNAVVRMTIGPSQTMNNLDEIGIIEALITFNDQSLELGWTSRVRIYNQINDLLNDSRLLLKQENHTGTLNKLNQLLKILNDYNGDFLNKGTCQLLQHHIVNLKLKLD